MLQSITQRLLSPLLINITAKCCDWLTVMPQLIKFELEIILLLLDLLQSPSFSQMCDLQKCLLRFIIYLFSGHIPFQEILALICVTANQVLAILLELVSV